MKVLKEWKVLSVINLGLMLSSIAFLVRTDNAQDIEQKQEQLKNNIEKMEKVSDQLKDSYKEIQDKLLGGIEEAINKKIDPPIKSIKDVKSSIDNIPSAILTLVHIGDVGSTADSIKDALDQVKSTLEGIKNTFNDVSEPLDPKKDSKDIYKNYDKAIKKLKAANDDLEYLKKLQGAF